MIEPGLLSEEAAEFIRIHEHDDVAALALRYRQVGGTPISSIIDQITGRRKARTKLPTYSSVREILYPPALNLEQCSSEATALFKARWLQRVQPHFELIADLTGGFGIDTWAFAQGCDNVLHVEPDFELQQLAAFNHTKLGLQNIQYVNNTAEVFLAQFDGIASAFYIDPSRRKANRKVYSFHDCEPDVVALLPVLTSKSRQVLIKASPLHDIQLAIRELKHVSHMAVVAVDHECRELLLRMEPGYDGDADIVTADITHSGIAEFSFTLLEEQQSAPQFSEPRAYLYEPNAAILKAGAFKTVAVRYGLDKLHVSTHLYTADILLNDFPGRVYKFISPVSSASVPEFFPDRKANIVLRNYPGSADELKRALKLHDGGDRYLLAFTSSKGRTLVAAERIR